MSIFSFNEVEKNVCSAYGKLTAISMIAGIAMTLGGLGVMAIAEKAEDKSNVTRARDSLAEQLTNQKELTEKYKAMFYSEERSGADTYKKLLQLQNENRRLEEKLEKLNSTKTTEGLGD